MEIVDVPNGASFTLDGNAFGTSTGAGVWTFSEAETAQIMAANTGDFKVIPPANSDVDFTIGVRAISTDEGTSASSAGLGSSPYRPVYVHLDAVADGPTMTANDVTGTEDQPTALDLTASLTDLDGSEVLSVTLDLNNAPNGTTLSVGTDNGDGTWTLASDQISNVSLVLPEHASGQWTLIATATSVEQGNSDTASSPVQSFTLTVDPVADQPIISTPSSITGTEDNAVALNVNVTLADTDGSENLSAVTLSGIPVGFALSAGMFDAGTGDWTVDAKCLSGLTLTPRMIIKGALRLR